jgi:hypothetical protein
MVAFPKEVYDAERECNGHKTLKRGSGHYSTHQSVFAVSVRHASLVTLGWGRWWVCVWSLGLDHAWPSETC